MNRVLTSITSLGLAAFLAGCGSDPQQTPDGGSGGTTSPGAGSTGVGTSGDTSVGTGGTPGGSVAGAPSGGSGNTGAGAAAPGGAPNPGGGGTSPGSAGQNNPVGGSDPGAGGSGPGAGGTDPGAGGGAGAPPVSQTPPNVLVTSSPTGYWQTSAMWTEAAAGTPTLTVDTSKTAQTWEGFGGSFNELGWSFLTSKALQDEAIKLLFSAADGAHFAWGRIPMGSSDYGTSRYSLTDPTGADDVPNPSEANRPAADLQLAKFTLSRDAEKLIPYIKAAQAVKPDLRFWASPWTPPVWMKTGWKTNSGADSSQNAKKPSFYDGGNMKSDTAILAAYAEYFKKFVEGYRAQQINVEVVAPQNEPGYDQNYPSCLWDATTFTTFIRDHLGPAMKAMNPPVSVMLGTLSNASDGGKNDTMLSSAVLADNTAKSFLSVAGVQWGVLDLVNNGTMFGGLPVWASEHKCGNYPWMASSYNNTQAPNDQAYGVESWNYIRDAINKGKVTSYNAWNMVLDRLGLGIDTTRDWKQNALLVVDGGMVKPTPTYYVFRHLSQYVLPQAQVVGTSGSGANQAVAFKNPDGSLVAVVFSQAANPNYVISMGGKNVQFSMPANGWATVKVTP